MAVYSFRARDAAGRMKTGTLSANTPAEGRQLLRDRSWRIERFAAALESRKASGPSPLAACLAWLRPGAAARRAGRVAEFSRHLALLLGSGVSLAEGLDVLIAQHGGGRSTRNWQAVLRDLRDRVAGGQALSEAMAVHPQWFGPASGAFLGAVRVGQESGTLDEALAQLALYLKERQTLSARLTTALVYPAILVTLGVGVVLFLMTYVIPQLLTVLEASGKLLPASTEVLKAGSDLLVGYWPWCLILLLAGAAGLSLILQTDRGLRIWHLLQLRMPLAGPLVRKTLIARFAQQMAMLLGSGVPFVEALATVRRGTRHRILAEELQAIEGALQAGSDIAPALAKSRIFPPLVMHLVAVGQNTGELTAMLGQLKTGYQTEVNLAVGRFTTALEPALIVVLAGGIGFIIFATMMPILEATRVMQ